MRKGLVAAILLGLIGATPALAKCREYDSERKPKMSEVLTIATPTGPFRYRETSWQRVCPAGERQVDRVFFGLADEKGRTLVPARYSGVQILTATMAVVDTGGSYTPAYRYYALGKGERKDPVPYTTVSGDRVGNGVVIPVAIKEKGNVSDYFAWTGGAEPVAFNNLKNFRHRDGLFWADFIARDGASVSRFFDLQGRPISPVVGEVGAWRHLSPNGTVTPGPTELVTPIGRFEHPLLPYDTLYMPLQANGYPAPLPEGAMGVFPLRQYNPLPSARVDRYRSYEDAYGWAVVYPTRDGIDIAPVFGTLAEAVRKAPTARRYSGMRRRTDMMTSSNALIDDVVIIRSKETGLWSLAQRNSLEEPAHDMGRGVTFADPDLAYRMYVADRNARQRGIVLAQEQERRRQAESTLAARQQNWSRIKAAGTLCQSEKNIPYLPVEAFNAFLRTCPVTDPFVLKSHSREVDPAALAEGRRKYDAHLAKVRAEIEATNEARFGLARSTETTSGDPWAAGLAAAQAASNSSYNAFMANQNAIYNSNLKAWNSGAQNWCCGADPD